MKRKVKTPSSALLVIGSAVAGLALAILPAGPAEASPYCYQQCDGYHDWQQPWNGQMPNTWDMFPYGGQQPAFCDPSSHGFTCTPGLAR